MEDAARLQLQPTDAVDPNILRALFAHSDAARDLSPLPDPLRTSLLGTQYSAWTANLRRYPGLEDRVIEVDGAVAGRLVLNVEDALVEVIDIVIAPEHRGAGLGTRILESVIARANGSRRTVRLFTRKDARALSLYRRLGFAPASHDELFVRLEWSG